MPPIPRAYKIGYARVSPPDQKLDSQLDALQQIGCNKVFSDCVSGIKAERPGWDQLLAYVRPGDTVVMTELSRMSRSLVHLLEVVRRFDQQGLSSSHCGKISIRRPQQGGVFWRSWGRLHRWNRN